MGTVSAPLTCGRASTTPHSPLSARHAALLGSVRFHARAASTSSAAHVSPIWRSTGLVTVTKSGPISVVLHGSVRVSGVHSSLTSARLYRRQSNPPSLWYSSTRARPTPRPRPPLIQIRVRRLRRQRTRRPRNALCSALRCRVSARRRHRRQFATTRHTLLGTPPRPPKLATHTRPWATIDRVRCEVIIDTGADLCSISAKVLRRHRSYQPWAPAHGSVTGVTHHTLQVLGRVALEVLLGPLKTTAPFFVVPGVALSALLAVDFLYEHEIAVSVARHALIFEGHGGQIFPLLGHQPRLAPLCALAHDVALHLGSTARVRTTIAAPATAPASPLVYLFAASTLPGVGLSIPEQLTSGLIVIRNTSARPLHLSAGWPLAKAVRLPLAAIHNVRLVATDSAPPPTDGTADTPSCQKLSGGFIATQAAYVAITAPSISTSAPRSSHFPAWMIFSPPLTIRNISRFLICGRAFTRSRSQKRIAPKPASSPPTASGNIAAFRLVSPPARQSSSAWWSSSPAA
ncbi:hypothetical protein Emag_007114 [Eimeria magna]